MRLPGSVIKSSRRTTRRVYLASLALARSALQTKRSLLFPGCPQTKPSECLISCKRTRGQFVYSRLEVRGIGGIYGLHQRNLEESQGTLRFASTRLQSTVDRKARWLCNKGSPF